MQWPRVMLSAALLLGAALIGCGEGARAGAADLPGDGLESSDAPAVEPDSGDAPADEAAFEMDAELDDASALDAITDAGGVDTDIVDSAPDSATDRDADLANDTDIDAIDDAADAADAEDEPDQPPPVHCPGLGDPAPSREGPGFSRRLLLSESPAAVDAVFGGLALVDTDADERLDIVYTDPQGELSLLRRCEDGSFYRDPEAFEGINFNRVRTVAYGDLDNDGDADLYVASYFRAQILINDGAARFSDHSGLWRLGTVGGRGGGAFVDFDNDGDLDLYETSYESRRNRLHRNDGDHFSLITEAPGNSPDMGSSLGAVWTDVNGDGLSDLFLVNDFGFLHGPNQLLLNRGPDPEDDEGWLFEAVDPTAGFGAAIFGMGVAVGDTDNDGDLDVYAANITNNPFHIVEPDGTPDCPDNSAGLCGIDRAVALGVPSGHYTDLHEPASWPDYSADSSDPMEAGLAVFCTLYCDPERRSYPLVSWTPILFDLDHNGWLDLFVSNGYILFSYMPIAVDQPNDMYLNDGGHFERVPTDFFPDSVHTTRGAAVGDLDADGDLDLAWIDNGRRGPWQLMVLENQAASGNWLRTRLRGHTSNRDGVGARLTLEAGDLTLTREVDGGRGYASSDERAPHFGLGEASLVDRLTIRWPSGLVQVLDDVRVNAEIEIHEPRL